MSRSRNHLIAAVLSGLLSLADFVTALVLLPRGAKDLAASGDQPPYAVVVIEVILGVLGLIAVYGVAKLQRWAIMLTLVVMILNVLSALPGVAFGPNLGSKASSALAVVVSGAVIWLLLRRESRAAAAAESATVTA